MKEPVWVDRRVVVAAHEFLLAEHGGAPGLRDGGLLDSALARPRQLFLYEGRDLAARAAAYAEGIVRNHPFVDGNKRTGFLTAYVFLTRNGLALESAEADAAEIVLGLAASVVSEADFAAWVRVHTKPVRKRARGPSRR